MTRLLALALAGLLAACGGSPAGSTSTTADPVCFFDSALEQVPCGEPHQLEQIGDADFSRLVYAPYPPLAATVLGYDEVGEVMCSTLADDLLGEVDGLRGGGVATGYPSPEEWEAGDKTAECLGWVEIDDGIPVIGDHSPIVGVGSLVDGTWEQADGP